MFESISAIVAGIIISVLGIVNIKGNISTVHWYHRKRVSKENILPFGKTIGLGTLICGVAVIVLGAMGIASELTKNELFSSIGSVAAVIGIAVGLGISFYAMFKYNKGIF